MIRRRILTAVVVVVMAVGTVVSLGFSGKAYAAQTSVVGGDALKISPVRMDIVMDPGTTKVVEVFITNLTSVPATLHPAINDFVASGDETGKPNIMLDENQFAPTHSFKQFVSPLANINLKGGEQRTVAVAVNIPKTAAGGGYYGAIRFAPANTNEAGGQKNLNLSASVGTIVLLKVNGEIKESVNLASLDVRKNNVPGSFFTKKDGLQAVARFQNIGNVQVEPFGKIVVKRFGKQVAQIEINNTDPRGSVLPDSIRRFQTPLANLSSFGKYTMEANFGYGTQGQLITAKRTFYIIPLSLILTGVGILLALIVLIFVLPRMIRSYNRRIIRKASRRR
ncbi:MAG TPA: DUF916 domain-containing protein [Bacillota bacterium]|nr:DUF916 domain-containing protein [Bacillota bacterium]